MKLRHWVLATTVMMGMSSAAMAQDWNAAPAYGSARLEAGFADDPHSIAIQAGGAIPAENLAPQCYGYITHQPSFSLDYEAGAFSLFFAAGSDADGIMVVRAPDGSFHCNDDAIGHGLNPGVAIEDPISGEYDIWVGSLGYGEGFMPGELHISEIGFNTTNRFSRPADRNMRPLAGSLNLRAGFADDPRTMTVQAGGDIDGSRATDGMCYGSITQAPDVWIDYDANSDFDLFVSMEADFDTTLAVSGPNGEWYCDDDSAGELNPGIRIRDPQSGRYAVWAGRYGGGLGLDATLFVSELGFRGDTSGPPQLDPMAEPNYGGTRLTAGFAPDPHNVSVFAGGDQDVYDALGQNCRGHASRASDYNLDYTAGALDLYLSATSESDITMSVMGPDGTWYCDDDGAGDLNPGLHFDEPQSGRYAIWVGTYSERDPLPATLHISELAFGDEYGMDQTLDYSLDANYGSVELEAGFMPDPHRLELLAGGPVEAASGADRSCRGYVSAAPDYELTYTAGELPLFISAYAGGDPTLVINTPSGEWVCNDDQIGFNPGIAFDNPESGVYDIWVGTYLEDDSFQAELQISEIGFDELRD